MKSWIIDSIINNKEWLFSGLGIFVIVEFFNFFKNKRKSKEDSVADRNFNTGSNIKNAAMPSESIDVKSDSKEDLSNYDQVELTPEYIRAEIDKVPPFQKKDIIKHYIGQNIDWEMEFFSAEELADGYVRIMLIMGNARDIAGFNVKLSKYPKLAITKKYAKVRVKGVIESIDLHLVYRLKDVILML